MTKREEAARAIWDLWHDESWDDANDLDRVYFFKTVDAVIACIREPDEKMLNAGFAGSAGTEHPNLDLALVWQAMIDAIGD